jgi:hypothetical protein
MHIQQNKERPVASTSAATPSSYEQLGQRIQKIINSPIAQRSARLDLPPRTGNARRLGHPARKIAENDNVTLAHRDDGGVQISGPYRRKTERP